MKNSKDNTTFYPVKLAVLCGLYPLLFYYSNNYSAINSPVHLAFFILFFIGSPLFVFGLGYYVFGKLKRVRPYKLHFLFVATVSLTVALMSQAIYLTIRKKLLLGVILVSVFISFHLYKHLKKVMIVLIILCLTNMPKLGTAIYDHVKPKKWLALPDKIDEVKLNETPNIYFIQTDGYVNEQTMIGDLYNYNSNLFSWLRGHQFKIYSDFRSNYPTSLASNAATFAMKQHKLGDRLFPSLEFPNSRDVITGNNPVLEILKGNNYETHFIVQDEYFQQNRSQNNYDSYNIDLAEIPFFSNDNNVKKDVFKDLKHQMNLQTNAPQFYFIEKLLPHHIHFVPQEHQIETERKWYLKRIDSVNHWVEKTVKHISKKDPKAIVLIQADHGGWVGLTSFNDMFTTTNKDLINSTFSSNLAVKWNGLNEANYDAKLKTNVNIFRVLFSALSKNKEWLNNLEDNSSYNLRIEAGTKSVKKLIDTSGNILID